MKKSLLVFLVISVSVLSMAGLQAETGYFYGKGLGFQTPDGTCSLEGRLYTLVDYNTDFEIGELYGLVDLGFAGAILSEPVFLVYPKEAYVEGYLEDLDFKAGIFYNSFGSGMALNPVNLFEKKIATIGLPMNGLELDYALDNGNLSGYLYTSLDENPDIQFVADSLSELKAGNLNSFNDPTLRLHTAFGGRLESNLSGIDTIFTVACDRADETITATEVIDGNETLVSNKPYLLKFGAEAVAQIPDTAFIIHAGASLGVDSNSLLLNDNSELDNAILNPIDLFKGVAGIEYQSGTTGLIGIEGYYDDIPGFAVYGDYIKNDWQVKGMGKGAVKSGNIVISFIGELDYKIPDLGTVLVKTICDRNCEDLLVFMGFELAR